MGGQNALVVMEDGDIEQAVQAVLNGAFMGEGQRCTATSRVFVHRSIYARFMERLQERTMKLKIGPGSNPENQVGSLVSGEALRSVVTAVRESIDNGMELLCGGTATRDGDLFRGHFMRPTILEGDPFNAGHLALRREIFGPVIGVSAFDNLDEVIAMVNVVEHRHAGALYTNRLDVIFRYAERANIGMVHGNEMTIGGDPQAGFGGEGGATSLGPQEMGLDCMDVFLRRKTVSITWNSAGTAVVGQGSK